MVITWEAPIHGERSMSLIISLFLMVIMFWRLNPTIPVVLLRWQLNLQMPPAILLAHRKLMIGKSSSPIIIQMLVVTTVILWYSLRVGTQLNMILQILICGRCHRMWVVIPIPGVTVVVIQCGFGLAMITLMRIIMMPFFSVMNFQRHPAVSTSPLIYFHWFQVHPVLQVLQLPRRRSMKRTPYWFMAWLRMSLLFGLWRAVRIKAYFLSIPQQVISCLSVHLISKILKIRMVTMFTMLLLLLQIQMVIWLPSD